MANLPIRRTTPDQQYRLLEAAQRNALGFINRGASPHQPPPLPPLPPVTSFSAAASLGAANSAAATASAVAVLGRKAKAVVEGARAALNS